MTVRLRPPFRAIIASHCIQACITTRQFIEALPELDNLIFDVGIYISDLHYSHTLTYHYTAGGIDLAVLKRWLEAEEYFEICVASPGTHPSALEMEALKKLKLVQLISMGKMSSALPCFHCLTYADIDQTSPLPKYTHPLLIRLFKSTSCHAFINAYPQSTELLREIYDKERQIFSAVSP